MVANLLQFDLLEEYLASCHAHYHGNTDPCIHAHHYKHYQDLQEVVYAKCDCSLHFVLI